MPLSTPANRPKAAWAVLLYGSLPEIQLLAGELDDSGLEIVRIWEAIVVCLTTRNWIAPCGPPEPLARFCARLFTIRACQVTLQTIVSFRRLTG
jgi:hypothetical protein